MKDETLFPLFQIFVPPFNRIRDNLLHITALHITSHHITSHHITSFLYHFFVSNPPLFHLTLLNYSSTCIQYITVHWNTVQCAVINKISSHSTHHVSHCRGPELLRDGFRVQIPPEYHAVVQICTGARHSSIGYDRRGRQVVEIVVDKKTFIWYISCFVPIQMYQVDDFKWYDGGVSWRYLRHNGMTQSYTT